MTGTYTVTLSDGTKIEGLGVDGNNFTSTDKTLKATDLTGKLQEVTITYTKPDTDTQDNNNEDIIQGMTLPEGTYENLRLVYFGKYKGKTYFVLEQPDPRECRLEQMEANIDYIAMMSNAII